MSKYMFLIGVMRLILEWYDRATKDKVVTDDEVAELITGVAKLTNLKIKVG